MGKLTKAQRKERIAGLRQYIAETQVAMGLTHWELMIYETRHPHKPEALAVVDPIEGRQVAELWLHDGALTGTAEDLRTTIVHELLHLHQARWLHAVDDLSGQFGVTAWNIFESGFRREVEYMTDVLAGVLAKHLPLPPVDQPQEAA